MDWTARRYDSGEPVRLEIEGGKIARLTPVGPTAEPLPWVAPALVDLQVNGHGGQEFSSPALTPEGVRDIVRSMNAFGVARIYPTVTTNRHDVMCHAAATIAQACRRWPDVARRVPGVHVEGPYLSPRDGTRGAHPLEHIRPPDWSEFERLQEASEGRIRILTLSPEYDNAPEFIRRVVHGGVLVAIGHTAAAPEQIHAAVDAGARMSTHLGNGISPLIHRHRNPLWAQLADDRLAAGLIVDRHHLPADMLAVVLRTKGLRRCVLVTDLSGLTGLPPGRYSSELGDVEILADGKLVVAGQRETLAGASAPLCDCVANAVDLAGVTLRDAIDMASVHPTGLLGGKPVRLEPGVDADLFFFDWTDASRSPDGRSKLTVRAILLAGEAAPR